MVSCSYAFISLFIAEIQPPSNRPCTRPQLVLTTLKKWYVMKVDKPGIQSSSLVCYIQSDNCGGVVNFSVRIIEDFTSLLSALGSNNDIP